MTLSDTERHRRLLRLSSLRAFEPFAKLLSIFRAASEHSATPVADSRPGVSAPPSFPFQSPFGFNGRYGYARVSLTW